MKKLWVLCLVITCFGCSQSDRGTVSARIRQLKHRDPFVRRTAAMALGDLGPEGAEAIPSLCAALDDPDPDVRRQAANALGQIGAGAAVPRLVRALEDENELVRNSAGQALRDIDPAEAVRTGVR